MPYLPALLILFAITAQAATVYRSVDENGVVRFSDNPPDNGLPAEAIQLDIQQPTADDEFQRNLQAMRETTDRMAADRRAREKHRAELRELEARTRAWEAPPQTGLRDYATYLPGYYPVYRPHRPHFGRLPLRPPGLESRASRGANTFQPPLRAGHGNGAHHALRKGDALNLRR